MRDISAPASFSFLLSHFSFLISPFRKILLLKQAEDFSNPKHKGCAEDADEPVVQREGRYVEHGASERNDCYLSEHDYRGDAYE